MVEVSGPGGIEPHRPTEGSKQTIPVQDVMHIETHKEGLSHVLDLVKHLYGPSSGDLYAQRLSVLEKDLARSPKGSVERERLKERIRAVKAARILTENLD